MKSIIYLLNIVFLCLVFFQNQISVEGFASWMTKDFCNRALAVNEIIMNDAVELSEERHVVVYRDKLELKSGDVYYPGESLKVVLDDPTGQYVLEQTNANFANGGCDGKRFSSTTKKAILTMPSEEEDQKDITIIAGWAQGHEMVKITHPFVLHPDSGKGEVTTNESSDKLKESPAVVEEVKEEVKDGESDILQTHEYVHRHMIPEDQKQQEDINLVDPAVANKEDFVGRRIPKLTSKKKIFHKDIIDKFESALSNLRGPQSREAPTWGSVIVIFLVIAAILGLLSAFKESRLGRSLFSRNYKSNE